jgi:predicted TPR repeat methyltransferase
MWYVIEHLARLREVLVKVNLLLKPGGLFAFSTPSAAGISFRKNRGLFLEKSPADHFTLWTARILRKALARFGFRVRKIRVTGHHPERFFPGAGKKPISIVLSLFSKVLRLGDTFEVYAVKERDCR